MTTRRLASRKLLGNVVLDDLVHGVATPLRSNANQSIRGVRLLCQAVALRNHAWTRGLLHGEADAIAPFHGLDVAKFTEEPITCLSCLTSLVPRSA